MNSRNTQLAYGIAYTEMANINLLSTQVQQATCVVAENQAIVTALGAKLDQFNGYLSQATDNRTEALAIYNGVKDMASGVHSLTTNVGRANQQMIKASEGMDGVVAGMSELVGKLIFSTEIIDKFSQTINKQKLINPLIPDTLIALMSKATADANKAISLTLIALQSSYAAAATSLEAKTMTALEEQQAGKLRDSVYSNYKPVRQTQPIAGNTEPPVASGILTLMESAHRAADRAYTTALRNVSMATAQLSAAQSALDSANTQLSSCSAGLAAATSAAYSA